MSTIRILLVVLPLLGFAAEVTAQSCTLRWACKSAGGAAGCARLMGGSSGTRVAPSKAACESALPEWRSKGFNVSCDCAGGGSTGGAASAGGLYTGDPGQTAANVAQHIFQSVNPQTPQQMGMAAGGAIMGGLMAGMIEQAMRGPSPQELAAREAARQEQLRLQREAAERKRLEDEARHRSLVAGLRGTEGVGGQLSLRRDGAASAPQSNLDLLRRDSGPSVPLTPFPQGSVAPADAGLLPPNSNLSLLRRGDDSGGALGELKAASEQGQLAAAAATPEEAAERARQVFDTPLQQKPVVDLRDTPQPIRADNAQPITGVGVHQGAPDRLPSANPTSAPATTVAAAPAGPKPQAAKPKPVAVAPSATSNSTPAASAVSSAPSSPAPTVVASAPPQSPAAPAPRPGYVYSGNGLIGGTSWIAGYNVPPGTAEEIQRKAIEMFRKQAELAGIPYNAAVDFDRYDFVLGVAASTSIIEDLGTRVVFDQLSAGRFTPLLQNAYNSLKGRQFDQLECHSNGAMICLAALRNKHVVATNVVLYGPQITPDSLREWQGLLDRKEVASVRVMVNQGDPVPAVAMLTASRSVTEGLLNLPLLYDAQHVRSAVTNQSPGVTVTLFSCSGAKVDLGCHDMRVYKRNYGCRPSSGETVPGTAIPGSTGLLEPPPPC